MDLQIKGKKALVSGSTAGIGFGIAAGLAREGASVIVNGRTEERVKAATAKIGGDVHGFAGNLASPEVAAKLFDRYPALDILVNNLGIFETRPFAEISDVEWSRMWEVNVMSGIRLSRHYFPGMLQRNQGRVIFISSESGVQIPKEMIHYGVTKTAQIAVARGMAELSAGTNVTVNTVLAGPTRSEGAGAFIRQMAENAGTDEAAVEHMFFEKIRPSSLLQRFATIEEVANLVVYLASPLASATNGAAMRAEGGVIQAIL
ncbi:MAG TPA: SDR family oxidoreductase [Bryobacteraceae bacterium]|nr:SDR family oxidoreductase [Bryobacteraceae bacterium]